MFPLTKRHLVALNKRIRNPHICYRDYKRLNVKQSFFNMRPLFYKKDVDYPNQNMWVQTGVLDPQKV